MDIVVTRKKTLCPLPVFILIASTNVQRQIHHIVKKKKKTSLGNNPDSDCLFDLLSSVGFIVGLTAKMKCGSRTKLLIHVHIRIEHKVKQRLSNLCVLWTPSQ